ncbi:glycosyl hydrolase [Acidaminobacter sp. JC074]|uniref:TIM-barrel domain-containing protein n=1 Tax=Acidaminobacter sp. JC074 TaxID=2530199 RepID=UPI001F10498A|nr:TIM-barrel domain-containing protein [Acidaminobacter sp. JC074]MCH4891329.1 glycosyl hydrolase [Acidaminobacter sp. JC074]
MILNQYSLDLNEVCSVEDIKIDFGESILIETSYDKVYGLGERYNTLNHKGHKVVNVVEEVFCNQGDKTYFPLPFFMLDNGYGIFIDTKKVISFDFGENIKIELEDRDPSTLYLLKGSYKEMIKDFLELTGQTKKAPKWVFGPWISAHRWNSQAIVDDVRTKLKDLRIPVTAMVLEQWSDEATFYIFNGAKYPDKQYLSYEDFDFSESPWPNPKEMVDQLHKDGIKLLLWQCPVVKYIPDDEPFNARHEKEWQYTKKNKMVIQKGKKAYEIPDGNWFNGSMIPDYSNKETLSWWFKNRQYLIDIGVDGFKTDGGEFIHTHAFNCLGDTHKALKNNYSLEYVKAYSDFLGKDRVAFSRAGYLGQQAYSLQWAGDQKSTFKELQSVYKAGINASLAGQINWGFDIAGFSGELPSVELYYRSNQMAVFTPIMQVHSEPVGGQFSAVDPIRKFNNERTIWNMAGDDQELLNDIRSLYNLRMNLLPYTYSEYLKALEEKTTLMKHMNIDYEGTYPESQYVYGDLIIAPVLKENQDKLEVKFPPGKYYNIFTNEEVVDVHIEHDIGLNDLFAFIREGSALVTQNSRLFVTEINNSLDYKSLHFSLYGDSGSYRFVDEKNDFIITWHDENIKIQGKKNLEVSYEMIR